MDPTVQFMWSRHRQIAVSPADWALQLIERDVESEAVYRLTDPHLHWQDEQRLIIAVLTDVDRLSLQDVHVLRREYEAESISDYLAGTIGGWALIRRGCDLFYDDEADDPGRLFWIQIAEDADGHGGQGIYLQWNFGGDAFDRVLRDALLRSGRPIRQSVPNKALNPSGGSGEL